MTVKVASHVTATMCLSLPLSQSWWLCLYEVLLTLLNVLHYLCVYDHTMEHDYWCRACVECGCVSLTV